MQRGTVIVLQTQELMQKMNLLVQFGPLISFQEKFGLFVLKVNIIDDILMYLNRLS